MRASVVCCTCVDAYACHPPVRRMHIVGMRRMQEKNGMSVCTRSVSDGALRVMRDASMSLRAAPVDRLRNPARCVRDDARATIASRAVRTALGAPP